MTDFAVDLAAECGPFPSGADLAGYNGYDGNLKITVEGVLNWGEGGMTWGLRVEKPTVTKTGRKGKPRHVLLLVADAEQTPADLFRQLAKMWDLGQIETGVSYLDPDAGEDPWGSCNGC